MKGLAVPAEYEVFEKRSSAIALLHFAFATLCAHKVELHADVPTLLDFWQVYLVAIMLHQFSKKCAITGTENLHSRRMHLRDVQVDSICGNRQSTASSARRTYACLMACLNSR